jgi:3'-5' exoribonuclease
MKRKAPGRASPRDSVRDGDFPWPAPAALEPGAPFEACYAILDLDTVRPAGSEALLRLSLGDARGTIEGWAPAALVPEAAEWLRIGAFIGIRGVVHDAGTGATLEIREIAPIGVGLEDLPLFLPSSTRDRQDMERELADILASVSDPDLLALLSRLLGPETPTGPGFRMAPAATRNHHAWLGGLLEHTLSVARLCDSIAAHYGPGIDRDLLITAALLHDIGKVREIGAQPGFPYTEEGRLLGHILLGLRMVADAAASVPGLTGGRLLLLEHLIAAHQGRYEWQSPREPKTAEASILHYADDLDAKLNRSRTPAANPLAAASPGPAHGMPTPHAPRPDATRRDDTLDLFARPAVS